jgi:rubrerythrin
MDKTRSAEGAGEATLFDEREVTKAADKVLKPEKLPKEKTYPVYECQNCLIRFKMYEDVTSCPNCGCGKRRLKLVKR